MVITCLLKLEGGAVVCNCGVGGGGCVGGAVLVVVCPAALKPSPPEDARRDVGLADDADIERCTPRWEGDAAPAPPEISSEIITILKFNSKKFK